MMFVVADGCGTNHVGAGDLTRPAERSSAKSGEQSSPSRTEAPENTEPCSPAPNRAGKGTRPYVTISRDLTPGDYDAPVFSLGGQDDYACSPDGREICYASNHDADPAGSTNNDLWIVPVTGGTPKDIRVESL